MCISSLHKIIIFVYKIKLSIYVPIGLLYIRMQNID